MSSKRKPRPPAPVDHSDRIARLEVRLSRTEAALASLAGRLRPIGEDLKRAAHDIGQITEGNRITLLEAARRATGAPSDFSTLLAKAANDTLRRAYAEPFPPLYRRPARRPARRPRRRGKR